MANSSAPLSGYEVARVGLYAGFTGNTLVTAVAVAKAESGWREDARYLTSQEDSRGLWQINWYAHSQFNGSRLYERIYNGQAAYTVWRDAGRSWRPWTTYTRGTFNKYMEEAYRDVLALKNSGYSGVGEILDPGSNSDGGDSGFGTVSAGPWDFSNLLNDTYNWLGYQSLWFSNWWHALRQKMGQ